MAHAPFPSTVGAFGAAGHGPLSPPGGGLVLASGMVGLECHAVAGDDVVVRPEVDAGAAAAASPGVHGDAVREVGAPCSAVPVAGVARCLVADDSDGDRLALG